MSRKVKIWIAIVTILACIGLLLVITLKGLKNTNEKFDQSGTDLLYYRLNDRLVTNATSLPIMSVFKEGLELQGKSAVQSTFEQSKFLQFETLNNIDANLAHVKLPKNISFIYGLVGSDLLAGKQALYTMLRKKLGEQGVLEVSPKSYITTSSQDMRLFRNDFSKDQVYILKKNIQRQLGHLITNNYDEIMSHHNEYVIIQEVLQNPFIVNARKINIRVYMLIMMVDGHNPRFYIYNDGFMYYTPKVFRKGSLDKDSVITTGYIDRKVYEENPLTLKDLYAFIGPEKAERLQANITNVFRLIKEAYERELQRANQNIPGTKFLIYGCDIAPDSDLNCKLMEINKGPDLTYKDERDKHVKLNMVMDALSIVGMVESKYQTRFVEMTSVSSEFVA